MTVSHHSSQLALVVPFHNEQRYLPTLIASLRNQQPHDVPMVFVDNASNDLSGKLVRDCEEVISGEWFHIEEPRVGKFHAMKTGTEFCRSRLGASRVGFLDADSYCVAEDWIAHNAAVVLSEDLGYVYSPIRYCGAEHLPIFSGAYEAYQQVLRFIVDRIGWLANGQGFVATTATLERYFGAAQVTAEIDLRLSLLALAEGKRAYLNPGLIMSSARRMVVNAHNFASWCFYEPQFYAGKDINDGVKLNLTVPAAADDLQPARVGELFERRSIKLVGRHLMPLLLFDQHGDARRRVGEDLGFEISDATLSSLMPFAQTTEYLFTARFEEMIQAIEQHPVSLAMAREVEAMMRQRYSDSLRAATNLERLSS